MTLRQPLSLLRFIAASLLATFCVVVSLSAIAADGAGAQITPLGEEEADDPPGLGSIIGSPEAGPKPEDAGDRGGWAQLFLAVVLFGGVGFIFTRIFTGALRSDDSP